MTFTVNFYKFNKHYNSTKRPGADTETVTYNCDILEGSAIFNPYIILDIGLAMTPAKYNYCFIPSFDNRYYFVKEWSFDAGRWTAVLECDVLATWRNTIGNTELYALRASKKWNGYIMDNKYPTKTNAELSHTVFSTPYTSVNAGCYVIGVVSKRGNFGSLTYHALSASEMGELCAQLQDPTLISDDGNFSLQDASAGLQLNLIDPMQYIKSCVWLPFQKANISGTDIPASGPQGGFDIYNWHLTGFTHRILSNTTPYVEIVRAVTLPVHPDAASRGAFVKFSPYTIRTVSYPPFGVFELDTSVASTTNTVQFTLVIDPLTGKGTLIVMANTTVLNRIEAQIGVPIALSQVTRDYIGAVSNALGAVGNIASVISNPAGNAISGMVGAAQGIINAGVSLVPRANTIGSGGGFSHLRGRFVVDSQFFRVVNDDINHNGRPLCEMIKPAEYGGYFIIQDGDIAAATTQIEGAKIKDYLETGFYWE